MAEILDLVGTCLARALECLGVALCATLAVMAARRMVRRFGARFSAAWRALAPRARAAALLVLAAFTIYGGGKGELRMENGEWKSENGELRTTPTFNFQLPTFNSSNYAAFSNICFTSIATTPTNVVLGIGWTALTNTAEVLDIYAKTNLLERLWRHLAELGVDAADGEALAEVPLGWLDDPPAAFFNLGGRLDADGDGLPDAFETLALGSSPALADTDGDGLDDFTEYLAGLDPSAEPPEFSAQGAALAALELVPAFSAEFPETFADSNVWQRTIHVEPLDGLRQYFISGSPDGAAPPDFGGMTLEWDDGIAQGTLPTNTAAFQLPLEGYSGLDLTLTLRRSGTAVSMVSPLYLLAAVPRTTIDAATTVAAGGTTYYATDFSATRHVDIVVDCSETPGTNKTVRSVFDSLSAFFRQSGIEVGNPQPAWALDDETCTLPLEVSGLGVHPLPSPVEPVPLRAGGRPSPEPPPRDGAGSTPAPSAILAIAPYIEWSGRHDASFAGDALAFDLATGTYANIYEYPLNSGCIWSAWHRDATGGFECSCTASVNLGTDDVPSGISTTVEYDEGGASGHAYLGGVEIWGGRSDHTRNGIRSAGESGTTLLSSPSSDGCGDPCGSCEGGSCDDLENPSLGSLRFRIPLSAPQEGHVDGFLFLNEDSAFWPDPSYFDIKARADADIEIVSRYGSMRMVRSNSPRGRQINIEGISRGVRLTVTNLFEGAGGKLDHVWEITRSGDAMRLRKISRAGNLMQDESFVLGGPGGQTVRIDNISGRTETVSRQGAFTEDSASEIVERRTVSDASGAVLEETETVLRRFGEGHSAVEREIARRRMTPLATNETFAIYWPDGKPLFSWGDDRPCRFTAFDDLGRETNSISYFCDRDALEDSGICFGDVYSPNPSIPSIPSFPFDVFQTVTSYDPLPGDDADSRDRDEPRRIDEYRTDADGEPVLVARTWFVHTRGAEQGWPARTVATIRAASQNAALGDPANAVSVSTAIDADAPGTPRVLRGKPVSEQDEDGAVTRHAWSPCAFSLENGAPAFASGSTHWLRVSTEEFGEETKPVAHVSVFDADTGSEVYSAQRHIASGLDFGWEAHLHDCRDRRVATLHADGSSSTNAYSCCRLLWTQGRDGAKTLRSATTGRDSLYYAMEEVSLAQLPHDDRYVPYESFYDSDYNAYRTTQHFMDAFGRETNTVVRTCKVEGVAVNQDWTCAGWRASSSVAYPFGTSDYRVATDQRGGETTTVVSRQPTADVVQTIASNKTTTVTSYRNGDGTTLEEWPAAMPDGTNSVSHSTCSIFNSDGSKTIFNSTFSIFNSQCNCVTNSITFHDFLGRVVRIDQPAFSTNSILHSTFSILHSYDGSSPRVLSTFDTASGLAVTNLYDDLGEHVGQIASGIETRTETGYEVVSNVLWRVETLSASPASLPLCVNTSTTRTRLAPLSDDCRSHTIALLGGATSPLPVTVSETFSSFDTNTLVLTETAISATTGTNIVKRKYGRVIETTDSTGTTQSFFDAYGRVFYTEHDGRSVDWIGRNDYGDTEEYDTFYAWRDYVNADFHAYDIFGNRIATTNALGDTTFYAYDAANRLAATWGATYPLLYGYDTQGHRTSLSTTRDPAANLSTFQPFNFSTCVWDETRWGFDPNTSLCTNKTYADGSTVIYTYTPDGKPLRTTYPSGRWKENAYDDARRLCGVSFSDGAGDSFVYDVFGQRVAESNAVASSVYLRDNRGNCTNETIAIDAITNTIERAYDDYGRLTQTSLNASASPREIIYAPDGRIAAISNAEAVVEYAYTSDRLDAGYTLTLANGTTFTRTVVRDAYRRNLILAITNAVNGVAIETLEYAYDALGRPISRNADAFGYNDRSEVVFSHGATENTEYSYDGIGNLLASTSGGITNTYTANCLNQYTLCASASLREFSYDADGNLLSDGVFTYAYDSENRLLSVTSATLTNGAIRVLNAHDAQGRRIRKTVQRLNSTTPPPPSPPTGTQEWQTVETRTFAWDGNNIVLETKTAFNSPTLPPTHSQTEYFWGLDKSGTEQGAGGVGGLLAVSVDGVFYIPCYDHNGNIVRYVSETGAVAAQYLYDPYGNVVEASGPLADQFSFGFSTKYHDRETGLVAYQQRFYHPPIGRWLNRDPIEEEGGENLYAFCGNAPVSCYDALGEAVFLVMNATDTSYDAIINQGHSEIYEAISELNAIGKAKFEKLVQCGRVYLNKSVFSGSFEKYKSVITRELTSCAIVNQGFLSSIAALRSMSSHADEPYDFIAYCVHGRLGWTDKQATTVTFSDCTLPQSEVISKANEAMAGAIGSKMVVSCYQTWNGTSRPEEHLERLTVVLPKLYKMHKNISGNQVEVLNFDVFKITKVVGAP